MAENYVRTSEAARAVGVSPRSLLMWLHDDRFEAGTVFRTPGGQTRWSVPRLKRQLGYPATEEETNE